FKDCGLKNLPTGQPVADLSGVIAERWGSYKIHISLSHTDEYAVAMVVVEDLS
ncbi:MAG: holo-ACP synthase, partial [Candidatus Kapabacteria bacterium]|nr:holo-ACP synthase [Candidatus Kapabacteria bacterium]